MREDYVARALQLAFPAKVSPADRFVMVMDIAGYFDESGTHGPDSPAVVVAGYLAKPECWIEFKGKWNKALRDFDIEFFHMADFAARKPPYDTEDWEGKSGDARFQSLAQIINDHAEWGIGIAIPEAALGTIAGPDTKEPWAYAYALAAVFCTLDVGRVLRGTYPDGKLRLTFDQGTRGKGTLFDHLSQMMGSELGQQAVPLLAPPVFENKQDFVPLQAADILVHSLYQQFCKGSKYIHFLKAPVEWSVLDGDNIAACSALFNLWWLSYGKPRRSKAPSPPPPIPERLRPQGIVIDLGYRGGEPSRSKKSTT